MCVCVVYMSTDMHIPLIYAMQWESWPSKAARFSLQHKYIVT